MLRYLTLIYVYVTLCYVTLRYVKGYVTFRYITLCYVRLRYVMLCYVDKQIRTNLVPCVCLFLLELTLMMANPTGIVTIQVPM